MEESKINMSSIIMDLLTNKIFLGAVAIIVVIIIIFLRTRKKTIINKYEESANKAETVTDKLLDKLDNMTDKIENDSSSKNDLNDKVIAQKINDSYIEKFIEEKAVELPEDFKEKNKDILKRKLGSIVNFVDRVDKDGKIILPLEAITFITGAHAPLVMPDGSIRVLNLLSIEEEILYAIKHKKPIFYLDSKKEEIVRIDSSLVDNILDETLEEKKIDKIKVLNKKIDEQKNKIKELQEINTALLNDLDKSKKQYVDLNQKYLRAEGKLELIKDIKISPDKNIIKNQEEEVKDNIQNEKATEVEKEELNLDDELLKKIKEVSQEKNQIVENEKNNKTVAKIKNQEEEVKDNIQNEKATEVEKEELKITKRFVNKLKKELFSNKRLFAQKNIANKNKKINEILFIHYRQNEIGKGFEMYFKDNLFKKEIENYLIENNYDYIPTDIEKIIELLPIVEKQMFVLHHKKNLYKVGVYIYKIDNSEFFSNVELLDDFNTSEFTVPFEMNEIIYKQEQATQKSTKDYFGQLIKKMEMGQYETF